MNLENYETKMKEVKQNTKQSIWEHGEAVKNQLAIIITDFHPRFPELSELSHYLYDNELLLTYALYHDIGKVKT